MCGDLTYDGLVPFPIILMKLTIKEQQKKHALDLLRSEVSMTSLSKAEVLELLKPQTIPVQAPQETITFFYGGWSLLELRAMNPTLFCKQTWYDNEPFAKEKHPEGIYTVCLKVPDSNKKTYAQQKELLGELCPVAIAATAYLLSFLQTRKDPLDNDYTRYKEQVSDGFRVILYWLDGRLGVDDVWDSHQSDSLWASSSQFIK
jgi:hypothetical protein